MPWTAQLCYPTRAALHESGAEELEQDRAAVARGLVDAACARARAKGFASITLSTFRDVAWNAPFYASAGFEEIPRSEWTEALRDSAADEAASGLDVERRVMMRRRLDGPAQA